MSADELVELYRARKAREGAQAPRPAQGPSETRPSAEQADPFRWGPSLGGAAATGAAYSFLPVGIPSLAMRLMDYVGGMLPSRESSPIVGYLGDLFDPGGAQMRQLAAELGSPGQAAQMEQDAIDIKRAIAEAPERFGEYVTEMLGGSGPPETTAQRLAMAAATGAGTGLPGLARLPGAMAPVASTAIGELTVGGLSGLAAQATAEADAPAWAQVAAGTLPYLLAGATTPRGIVTDRSLQGIRQKRGYAGIPANPLPKSAIAEQLQAELRAARTSKAAPISQEFDAVRRELRRLPIAVDSERLVDLVESAQRVQKFLTTSVPKEIQELVRTAPAGPQGTMTVAEALQPFLGLDAQGFTAVSADQVMDFADAVQSVLNKVKTSGDKRSLLKGIKNKADVILEQSVPEQFKRLQKARGDWAEMKTTFDSNPTVKGFLRRDSDPEAVLNTITSGTKARHLAAALGEDGMETFRSLLVDELTREGSARKALTKLQSNEKYRYALGEQYSTIRKELAAAASAERKAATTAAWIDKTLGGAGTNAVIALLKGLPTALTKVALKAALERAGRRLSTFELDRLYKALHDPNVLRAMAPADAAFEERGEAPRAVSEEVTEVGPAGTVSVAESAELSPGASDLLDLWRARHR